MSKLKFANFMSKLKLGVGDVIGRKMQKDEKDKSYYEVKMNRAMVATMS